MIILLFPELLFIFLHRKKKKLYDMDVYINSKVTLSIIHVLSDLMGPIS
jgi:hypothetical protein